MSRVTIQLAVLVLVAVRAPASAAPPPKNVAIVVYDGVEILDFAGPAEVLAAANNFASDRGTRALNLYIVGKTLEPVRAQGFIKVTPEYTIGNAPRPDIVVIPGGNSDKLSSDPAMMTWLASTTAASQVTLTVCTGAFPLAKLGVFDGLTITTWFGAIERLQAIAPKARVEHGRRFVDNGRYITTAGVSAGLDGALHLVARTFGRRIADQTARYMEYHWTPEPYLARRYAYWNPSTDERGRALQAAQLAVEENRTAQAIAAYRKLAPSDPSGTTWSALGDLLVQTKDWPGAIAAYAHVGAKSPVFAKATYNLACAHARSGNARAAMTALQKAFAAGIPRSMALSDPDLATVKDQIARLP